MYVPDRVFMERMRALDKKLGCIYNPDIHRFVITYDRVIGEPASIYVVGDRFRQPDQRDLYALYEGDLHRVDADERFKKLVRYFEEDKKQRERETRDEWRRRTVDDRIQLSNVFSRLAGAGKGNSAFRRINQKPKGKVFKQKFATA